MGIDTPLAPLLYFTFTKDMTASAPLTLSAVVPVFNSQDSLSKLIERLIPVLSAAASDFEVILVNDGSRDDSWRVVQELSAAEPRVRGLNLMRNYGQHLPETSGKGCLPNRVHGGRRRSKNTPNTPGNSRSVQIGWTDIVASSSAFDVGPRVRVAHGVGLCREL